MSDILFKLKLLPMFLSTAINDWKAAVWKTDLDAPYCCSGGSLPDDICGCKGVTTREVYEDMRKRG